MARGILTPASIGLDDLLARVVPDGDCLVWQGYCDLGRFPQWRVSGRNQAARRVVWELVHGPIRKGHQVGVRRGCAANCCHPDHLVARSKSRARRGMQMPAAHRSNITRTRQANSDLTWDDVRAIRASELPCPTLAAQYGISRNHVWRIRKHLTWRDTRSPFAQLLQVAVPVASSAMPLMRGDGPGVASAVPVKAKASRPATRPGTVAAMDASLARAVALARVWGGVAA